VKFNGNGTPTESTSRPRTPSLNTLSLTEYSSNPTPPSQSPKSKVKGLIPDEFILPNGYADVCGFNLFGTCLN
jgi:threonine dehydratase